MHERLDEKSIELFSTPESPKESEVESEDEGHRNPWQTGVHHGIPEEEHPDEQEEIPM